MSTHIRGSQLSIEQVTTDPVSPQNGQLWVLKTPYFGRPMGLLLSLTYSADKYQLSYRTFDGVTVRTGLA